MRHFMIALFLVGSVLNVHPSNMSYKKVEIIIKVSEGKGVEGITAKSRCNIVDFEEALNEVRILDSDFDADITTVEVRDALLKKIEELNQRK